MDQQIDNVIKKIKIMFLNMTKLRFLEIRRNVT